MTKKVRSFYNHYTVFMLEAVIFDMDGVILDSEPFWRQSDIISYAKVGISLTDEMCRATTGLGTYESISYWYQRFPWTNLTFDEVKESLFSNVIQLVKDHGVINPGVTDLLTMFEKKGLKIGLASSSPPELLDLVVTKFGIKNRFQVIHSADHESYGKPHPAVYLSAAEKLGVEPVKCLAFEDSFNGLLAAKSARLKAVAILEEHNYLTTRFDFADLKIRSLTEFTEEHYSNLVIL